MNGLVILIILGGGVALTLLLVGVWLSGKEHVETKNPTQSVQVQARQAQPNNPAQSVSDTQPIRVRAAQQAQPRAQPISVFKNQIVKGVLVGLVAAIILFCLVSFLLDSLSGGGASSAKSFVKFQGDLYCDDSYGIMEIQGTVKNTGTADLDYVTIRGNVLDQSGSVYNTNTTFLDSDVLAAGATSTFTMYLNSPGWAIDKNRCSASVESASFK
jgi:hypothetical protein